MAAGIHQIVDCLVSAMLFYNIEVVVLEEQWVGSRGLVWDLWGTFLHFYVFSEMSQRRCEKVASAGVLELVEVSQPSGSYLEITVFDTRTPHTVPTDATKCQLKNTNIKS